MSATPPSGEQIDLTADEHESVKRIFPACRADAPSADGAWYVHPRLHDGMIAQGLWHYAHGLLLIPPRERTLEAENMMRKAMAALVKSYKMFPLPITVFQIAVVADWLGEPQALPLYSQFIEEQAAFAPDDIQSIF